MTSIIILVELVPKDVSGYLDTQLKILYHFAGAGAESNAEVEAVAAAEVEAAAAAAAAADSEGASESDESDREDDGNDAAAATGEQQSYHPHTQLPSDSIIDAQMAEMDRRGASIRHAFR